MPVLSSESSIYPVTRDALVSFQKNLDARLQDLTLVTLVRDNAIRGAGASVSNGHLVVRAYEVARHMPAHTPQTGKTDAHHAAFCWPIPEIAWTRLSSVTSAAVNSRMMRPWNIARMRSDTCNTSGISDEITMTA